MAHIQEMRNGAKRGAVRALAGRTSIVAAVACQAGEFTLTQRLGGIELVRATGQSAGDPHADII